MSPAHQKETVSIQPLCMTEWTELATHLLLPLTLTMRTVALTY